MKITRDNYEIYFIDYNDNNLNKTEIIELNFFLDNNTDLKKEFHLFVNDSVLKLQKTNVNFTYKNDLKCISNNLYLFLKLKMKFQIMISLG